MKRTAIALAATLATSHIAESQTYHDLGSTIPAAVVPLVGCPAGGGTCSGPISSTNPLPVIGTFSASLSGFAPSSSYATPLSASTTSARVALGQKDHVGLGNASIYTGAGNTLAINGKASQFSYTPPVGFSAWGH